MTARPWLLGQTLGVARGYDVKSTGLVDEQGRNREGGGLHPRCRFGRAGLDGSRKRRKSTQGWYSWSP